MNMDELASKIKLCNLNNTFVDEAGYLSDESDNDESVEDDNILSKYTHDFDKETDDMDVYMKVCKYFLHDKNYEKEKKYLQIFYKKMYKKFIIMKHHICFDHKNETYNDINEQSRKSLIHMDTLFKKTLLDLRKLNRNRFVAKNDKKVLSNILRFYTYVTDYFINQTNYQNPEDKDIDSVEVLDNMMNTL
jgi:hypothetical protein